MEEFAQPSIRRNSDGYENEVSQVATQELQATSRHRRNLVKATGDVKTTNHNPIRK